MSKTLANQIFRKWKADLADKTRSWAQVSENFDELFYTLHMANIDMDIAESLIKEAAHAHMPTRSQTKRTYQGQLNKRGKTLDEFSTDWRDGITNKTEQAFFTYYKIDIDIEPQRKFGNMSPQEYSRQRSYVDTFHEVDMEAIRAEHAKILDEEYEEIGGFDGNND